MALVRLSTLYTKRLNALGRGPMVRLDSGEMVVDEEWEVQHRSHLVSAIFCLETAIRFMEKLRAEPGAYELVRMEPALAGKVEIQLRLKLSMLLLNYTSSHRHAEFHLNQAVSHPLTPLTSSFPWRRK